MYEVIYTIQKKAMLKSKNEGNTKIYMCNGITVSNEGYTIAIKSVQETIVDIVRGRKKPIYYFNVAKTATCARFLQRL